MLRTCSIFFVTLHLDAPLNKNLPGEQHARLLPLMHGSQTQIRWKTRPLKIPAFTDIHLTPAQHSAHTISDLLYCTVASTKLNSVYHHFIFWLLTLNVSFLIIYSPIVSTGMTCELYSCLFRREGSLRWSCCEWRSRSGQCCRPAGKTQQILTRHLCSLVWKREYARIGGKILKTLSSVRAYFTTKTKQKMWETLNKDDFWKPRLWGWDLVPVWIDVPGSLPSVGQSFPASLSSWKQLNIPSSLH